MDPRLDVLSRRWRTARLLAACAATAVASSGSGAAADFSGTTHLVTAENRSCANTCTYVDGPWHALGSNEALVTANWNPPGSGGVYYDSAVAWNHPPDMTGIHSAILGTLTMPVGAAFNVLTWLGPTCAFLHSATDENTSLNFTVLGHPFLDDDDEAFLLVGGRGITRLDVGVYYESLTGAGRSSARTRRRCRWAPSSWSRSRACSTSTSSPRSRW
jgi:hypothetical protein